jgi:23S rRNA-intervening sequence protein
MTDNARRTGPAVEAHYRLIGWLMNTVERFPRSQRFLLGDRIQTVALDVLDALIEATYTRDRRGHLACANLGLEKLRFLVRLAFDRRHLDARRYEHAARSIDEVGRLIGGWAKAHAAASGVRPRGSDPMPPPSRLASDHADRPQR